MELKVEIVATDFIKPSSPNPNHPKTYQLTLMDQLNFPENIPLVLYYSSDDATVPRSSISQHLKNSLSTTLNHFYLFAGRINSIDGLIDCSTDVSDGVLYKEANAATDLADVVAKRDPNMVWPLLPANALFDEDPKTIPLQIQATFFQCGGMTIGICASHLVMDGVSYADFLSGWAAVSLEQGVQLLTAPPDLVTGRSLFPPSDLVKLPEPNIAYDDNVVTKSLVFNGASIAELKRHIAKANYHKNQPTRVQSVLALLWKCMMNAVSTNSGSNNSNSSAIMTIYVNLRTRLNPPLPQNTLGNFVGSYHIQKDYEGENMNLSELTDLQKSGLKDLGKRVDVNKEELSSVVLELFDEKFNIFARQDVDLFAVSSWCGFKLYELDFGWGKPIWASTNYGVYPNRIMLFDTKEGDGVEAWVSLKNEDMAAFEQNKELLSFASFSSTSPNLSNGK